MLVLVLGFTAEFEDDDEDENEEDKEDSPDFNQTRFWAALILCFPKKAIQIQGAQLVTPNLSTSSFAGVCVLIAGRTKPKQQV